MTHSKCSNSTVDGKKENNSWDAHRSEVGTHRQNGAGLFHEAFDEGRTLDVGVILFE
jgi:hypothetical protein